MHTPKVLHQHTHEANSAMAILALIIYRFCRSEILLTRAWFYGLGYVKPSLRDKHSNRLNLQRTLKQDERAFG